jgi:hypothetical protein
MKAPPDIVSAGVQLSVEWLPRAAPEALLACVLVACACALRLVYAPMDPAGARAHAQVSSLRSVTLSTPSTVIGPHSPHSPPRHSHAATERPGDGRRWPSEPADTERGSDVQPAPIDDFQAAGSLRRTVAEVRERLALSRKRAHAHVSPHAQVRTHISGLQRSHESLRYELHGHVAAAAGRSSDGADVPKAPRNAELEHLLKEVDSEIEKTKKLATVMRNSPPAPNGNKPGMVPYP